jgi:uncharacterized membrane protein
MLKMNFKKWKKKSLACISTQKVIWKATTTTLPKTLCVIDILYQFRFWQIWTATLLKYPGQECIKWGDGCDGAGACAFVRGLC